MRFLRAAAPLLLLLLLAAAVQADPASKSRRAGQSPAVPMVRATVLETEPNDDCATADAMAVGDVFQGTIDPSLDTDYVAFTVEAGDVLAIHTVLSNDVGQLGDSVLFLYTSNCGAQLAFNDDSVGLESMIIYEFASAGTYVAAVAGYDESETGDYLLQIETMELDPVGDDCEHATSIPSGAFEFTSTTQGLNNDYAYDSYGTETPDAAYGFRLGPDESFSCQLDLLGADFVIYLVTDCADPEGTLLEYSDDDPESLAYTNSSGVDQVLYLIIDGYGSGDEGGFIMSGTNGGTGLVANEPASWGEVKTLYR